MKNSTSSSHPILDDALQQFLSRNAAESRHILTEVFECHKVKEIRIASKDAAKISVLISKFNEDVFSEFLSRADCPDFLGYLVADRGSADLQNVYLFGSELDDEVKCRDHVARRPSMVKDRMIRRGLLRIVDLMLRLDSYTFSLWARELGYSDANSGQGVVSLDRDIWGRFDDWADSDLRVSMKVMTDRYFSSKRCNGEISDQSIDHQRLFEVLGGMGWDYWKNGWSNGYGVTAWNIADVLLRDERFSGSVLLKKSIKIYTAILRPEYEITRYPHQTKVIEALDRLDVLVAAWCRSHPYPG